MALALFDLDNTLIAGDSDHLWGRWLCTRGHVDSEAFAARNDRFYSDYQRGELDIDAYLHFALAPLKGLTVAEVARWHREFMGECIEPVMLDAARALLAAHRARGDELVIITATNEVVTRPIADALGVSTLIASGAEVSDGRYTGRPRGIPSFREGKVSRLEAWLAQRDVDLSGAWFYSDSHNDLPLLGRVGRPVAVDPNDPLRAHALEAGWPLLTLRAGPQPASLAADQSSSLQWLL
jgi:HAD superfamily hydrolase (TIGR01490 family)